MLEDLLTNSHVQLTLAIATLLGGYVALSQIIRKVFPAISNLATQSYFVRKEVYGPHCMDCAHELSEKAIRCPQCGSEEPFSSEKILDLLSLQIFRVKFNLTKQRNNLFFNFIFLIVLGYFFAAIYAYLIPYIFNLVNFFINKTDLMLPHIKENMSINLFLMFVVFKYIHSVYQNNEWRLDKTEKVVNKILSLSDSKKSAFNYYNRIQPKYKEEIFKSKKTNNDPAITAIRKDIKFIIDELGFKDKEKISELNYALKNKGLLWANFFVPFLVLTPTYALSNNDPNGKIFLLFIILLLGMKFRVLQSELWVNKSLVMYQKR